MNLQQILDTERAVAALESRLCGILDPEIKAHLRTLRFWAAEIRHFSVCWDDSVKAEAVGQMDQQRAEAYRQACIDRLVQTFRPS